MLEDEQPVFILGLFQDTAFCFQRNQRLDVVSHYPGQRQVCVRGNQVAEIEGAFAFRLDEHTLVEGSVPGSWHDSDSFHDLFLAAHQLQLI